MLTAWAWSVTGRSNVMQRVGEDVLPAAVLGDCQVTLHEDVELMLGVDGVLALISIQS